MLQSTKWTDAAWLFPAVLWAGAAAASIPVCPSQQPPADASAAPPRLVHLFEQARDVQRESGAVGLSASVGSYCVTPHAVFFDPDWLALDVAPAGPGPHPAAGRIAFALAARRHFLLREQPEEQAVQAAATATGCTLTRLGLRPPEVATRVADIEAAAGVAPGSLVEAFQRGVATCSAR